MHPIACRVNDGWGDKHERVPVKRVWFAGIKVCEHGGRRHLSIIQSKNQSLAVQHIH